MPRDPMARIVAHKQIAFAVGRLLNPKAAADKSPVRHEQGAAGVFSAAKPKRFDLYSVGIMGLTQRCSYSTPCCMRSFS
jgi:hypothetical protein